MKSLKCTSCDREISELEAYSDGLCVYCYRLKFDKMTAKEKHPTWLDKDAPSWMFYVVFIGFFSILAFLLYMEPITGPFIDSYNPEPRVTAETVEPQNKTVIETVIETRIEIIEVFTGVGSYYDYDLNRPDQKCLTDDCYSIYNSTCASRDFERGTILIVTNLDNGKKVECRVNDFGPQDITRKIDLSSYAFNQISKLKFGLANVSIIEK